MMFELSCNNNIVSIGFKNKRYYFQIEPLKFIGLYFQESYTLYLYQQIKKKQENIQQIPHIVLSSSYIHKQTESLRAYQNTNQIFLLKEYEANSSQSTPSLSRNPYLNILKGFSSNKLI
ncbi:hypothetical protein ABPG72_010731 [Tetrahymena utriculariae]